MATRRGVSFLSDRPWDEVRTATRDHAIESRQTDQPMRRTNWLPDIPMLIAQLDEVGVYGFR